MPRNNPWHLPPIDWIPSHRKYCVFWADLNPKWGPSLYTQIPVDIWEDLMGVSKEISSIATIPLVSWVRWIYCHVVYTNPLRKGLVVRCWFEFIVQLSHPQEAQGCYYITDDKKNRGITRLDLTSALDNQNKYSHNICTTVWEKYLVLFCHNMEGSYLRNYMGKNVLCRCELLFKKSNVAVL